MHTINIDGHEVRADRADAFYNGGDGSRVSDEQWDVSRDRTAGTVEELRALGFEFVGDQIPPGHEFAEEVGGNGGMVTSDDTLGG